MGNSRLPSDKRGNLGAHVWAALCRTDSNASRRSALIRNGSYADINLRRNVSISCRKLGRCRAQTIKNDVLPAMILHGNRDKSRLARLIRPRVTAESEGRRQVYGSTVRRSGHKRRLGFVLIDNLAIAGLPVSDAKTIPSGIHTRHVARFGNGTIRGRPNREKPKTFEYITCCLIFRQFC